MSSDSAARTAPAEALVEPAARSSTTGESCYPPPSMCATVLTAPAATAPDEPDDANPRSPKRRRITPDVKREPAAPDEARGRRMAAPGHECKQDRDQQIADPGVSAGLHREPNQLGRQPSLVVLRRARDRVAPLVVTTQTKKAQAQAWSHLSVHLNTLDKCRITLRRLLNSLLADRRDYVGGVAQIDRPEYAWYTKIISRL